MRYWLAPAAWSFGRTAESSVGAQSYRIVKVLSVLLDGATLDACADARATDFEFEGVDRLGFEALSFTGHTVRTAD
jgi:hypothetical protein